MNGAPTTPITLLSEEALQSLLERAAEEGARRAIEQLEKRTLGWLDTEGAAEYLGLTPEALNSLVKRGEIRPSQPSGVGCRRYFSREQLDAYVRGENVRTF
jgi:excisionase family DNA binding protein